MAAFESIAVLTLKRVSGSFHELFNLINSLWIENLPGGLPLSTKNLSAEKRMRQNEKRRLRNKSAKSAIRTASKKVVVAAQANNVAEAKAALQDMIKRIDTAARKGIVKKNTAARKKSRMQKLVNRLEG